MPATTKRFDVKTVSLKHRFVSAGVLALVCFASPSLAATAEERAACTPDVFRLCSSEIPNVERIIACMKRERPKLSPACKAVFNPDGKNQTAKASPKSKVE